MNIIAMNRGMPVDNNPPPLVTIVIVPRERFSVAWESLQSILAQTGDLDYRLIYVDAGSPEPLRSQLRAAADEHGFTLLRRRSLPVAQPGAQPGAAAPGHPLRRVLRQRHPGESGLAERTGRMRRGHRRERGDPDDLRRQTRASDRALRRRRVPHRRVFRRPGAQAAAGGRTHASAEAQAAGSGAGAGALPDHVGRIPLHAGAQRRVRGAGTVRRRLPQHQGASGFLHGDHRFRTLDLPGTRFSWSPTSSTGR